jgi:hypothetical protein
MIFRILGLCLILNAYGAFAFSTLKCTSNQNLTYTSQTHVGGAKPVGGMIINIEEIKQDNKVIYRKLTREGCFDRDFCHTQDIELEDVTPANFTFSFVEDSKHILSSESHGLGSLLKETFAVLFRADKEVWMICDSSMAILP